MKSTRASPARGTLFFYSFRKIIRAFREDACRAKLVFNLNVKTVVTAIIRFISILNAAVWCGSAIFIVVGLPALFVPSTKTALGDWNTGLAAQAVLARFFILQYWCFGLALAHLLADWWFFNRALWRINLGLVAGLGIFALVAGLWLQPKLIGLRREKYQGPTVEQREQADRSFKAWHGAAQGVNLLVIFALMVYVNEVTRVTENGRFISSAKIRG